MAKHRNHKNEPEIARKPVESAQQPDAAPRHEDVEVLAYRLWQEAGCRDGCAEEDWYRAEQLLKRAVSEEAREGSVRASTAA